MTSFGELALGPLQCQLSPGGDAFQWCVAGSSIGQGHDF